MVERKILWEGIFYYDETSPSCLRWNISKSGGRYGNIPIILQGGTVGGINSAGYWVVRVDGKQHRVHRIIMEMHNIECTGLDVDHINRKRDDNRIENLRAVTRSVNAHNQKLRITNKTGVMGVSYDPSGTDTELDGAILMVVLNRNTFLVEKLVQKQHLKLPALTELRR